MSQDVKTKKEITKSGLLDFDWDAHVSDCPSSFRRPNTHVKSPEGVVVYSRAPYAQELCDLMERFETASPRVFNVIIGETHTGDVYSVDSEWASIDIGHREMVYVDMSKENQISKDILIPGANLTVEIVADRMSNSRGFIVGSVEAGIRAAALREMLEATEEQNVAYIGTVTGMIPNGGYFVDVQGIDCFMPGSLAGINKLVDFESVVNTEMYVVPMSYSQERGTVIVSHRKYLQALIPGKVEELRNNLGETKTGNVTGSAKYGVFVEFDGCLTGMIHANDLEPEMARKHKDREIQPGDIIVFKVKEIISDSKITLTQVEYVETIDPWKEIASKYKSFPVEVVGIIKSVKEYGVFVDIGDGIVGLLHVSELPEGIEIDTISKNDNITVQITRIEVDTRKVFLKL